MNNNDVLAMLHNHWTVYTDYYPVERRRLQHALPILFFASTSAQPGTLIEDGGYCGENDKDIKAYLVKNLDNPSRTMHYFKR
jgi:hypothetical protein